jgi:hypothetical protein
VTTRLRAPFFAEPDDTTPEPGPDQQPTETPHGMKWVGCLRCGCGGRIVGMLVISSVRSAGQRTEIDVWATNAARLVQSVWCRPEPVRHGFRCRRRRSRHPRSRSNSFGDADIGQHHVSFIGHLGQSREGADERLTHASVNLDVEACDYDPGM